MSFDTMMASATDSTITMAVAADRPPTKAISVRTLGLGRQRQRQHEHVAVDLPAGNVSRPAIAIGTHEQVDQHEIERKQPGARA